MRQRREPPERSGLRSSALGEPDYPDYQGDVTMVAAVEQPYNVPATAPDHLLGRSARAIRWFWVKLDRDWGWNLARLLAYTCLQALFAVMGLDVVVLAIALRVVGPPESGRTGALTAFALRVLPDHLAGGTVSTFAASLREAPTGLLVLALPVAIWYGSRFFVVLESCLCVVFRREQRRFWRQNGVALAMLGVLAILVPVVAISAVWLPPLVPTAYHAHGLAVLRGASTLTGALSIAVGLGANFALVLLCYTLVTPGGISVRVAWPGALVGACLAELYLLIFPLYVRYVLQPSHFGSVAGFVLVAVVFFYAFALFMIIGAEVAAARLRMPAPDGSLTGALARLAPSRQAARAVQRHRVRPTRPNRHDWS
ncbi:MAG TPA: YhjD/YihY/BrkB family envelope integrity protein [Ktedonobacterales bacterium]